jgi:hypothetical protein
MFLPGERKGLVKIAFKDGLFEHLGKVLYVQYMHAFLGREEKIG